MLSGMNHPKTSRGRKTIALLSDFGLKDHYVSAMKGVILNISPDVNLVDITHEVSPWNVIQGAFLLRATFRYFPRGTVFVCVVDPGVGTERKALAIKTKNYFFVGPDNGLMYPSVVEDGLELAVEITNRKYTLERSGTFDGRDVFAPAAAHILSLIHI